MHDWLIYLIYNELERIYYVKYGGDPFYLVTDDLKGYFKYSKEKKYNRVDGRAEFIRT